MAGRCIRRSFGQIFHNSTKLITLKGFNMIQPSDFTRIKNDVNGNPRFVCHFLHFSRNYAHALHLAKSLGGRKFHNKQYGGGIVFQEYDGLLPDLCKRINELTEIQGESA